MKQERVLSSVSVETAREATPDLQLYGAVGAWRCLAKASSQSQGWMKTTKAMTLGTGCLVQTETQQRNGDGSWSLSQALAYVPGVSAEEIEIEDEQDADDVEPGSQIGDVICPACGVLLSVEAGDESDEIAAVYRPDDGHPVRVSHGRQTGRIPRQEATR